MSKSHRTGAHFSYFEKRHEELYSHEKNTLGGLAIAHEKLDLNETRDSARQNLAHSILMIHKRIECYAVGKYGN